MGWRVVAAVIGAVLTGACAATPRATLPGDAPGSTGPSPEAISGSASSPTPSTSVASSDTSRVAVVESTQILGVLTADSERQLVINFMGGACDVSARGYADEAGSAIVVHVLVTRRQAACPAVGYLRTVVAQLAGSWGEQHIVDSQGASVPTIDGSLLLTPGWLPDGYQGGAANVGATDGNTTAAQTWAPPEVDTTSAAAVACPPQAAGVELIQGYGVTPHYALLPGSHVLANGSTVRADRDEQQNVGLYWTPPHHPAGWTAALYSSSRCSGDTPVPLETLMTIANSLR